MGEAPKSPVSDFIKGGSDTKKGMSIGNAEEKQEFNDYSISDYGSDLSSDEPSGSDSNYNPDDMH